ncbi:single-stranded DNA-binding protein [Candidatus Gottesmanbacteria bacterium]|nr:single-stranded DNA-binding protein [Candidatus Gottesmanbacteria bacterium]
MAARSLNKVILIGNLTRDPELRYTPAGTAVCSFGLATNRAWTTDAGEKREEAEFHRIVSWNKLAELCAQLLTKGRKVFVEGRLQTRTWQAQDGAQRTTTEIVISDMIILDSRRALAEGVTPPSGEAVVAKEEVVPEVPAEPAAVTPAAPPADKKKKKTATEEDTSASAEVTADKEEEINPDDIPF